jgi:hypothetical protein
MLELVLVQLVDSILYLTLSREFKCLIAGVHRVNGHSLCHMFTAAKTILFIILLLHSIIMVSSCAVLLESSSPETLYTSLSSKQIQGNEGHVNVFSHKNFHL